MLKAGDKVIIHAEQWGRVRWIKYHRPQNVWELIPFFISLDLAGKVTVFHHIMSELSHILSNILSILSIPLILLAINSSYCTTAPPNWAHCFFVLGLVQNSHCQHAAYGAYFQQCTNISVCSFDTTSECIYLYSQTLSQGSPKFSILTVYTVMTQIADNSFPLLLNVVWYSARHLRGLLHKMIKSHQKEGYNPNVICHQQMLGPHTVRVYSPWQESMPCF
jgi:hypothetical protein